MSAANKKILSAEWLSRAREDEKSIRAILKNEDGSPSTACFLSQQMAEKCLKGMIVARGGVFPKVHDLIELETRIRKFDSDIKKLHDDLVLLNRYYVETRYPGD